MASASLVVRARRLEEICARHSVPLVAAALQFSLRDPRIASTIVGLSKPEHLAETLALAHYPIAGTLWSELRTVPPDAADPGLGHG